MGGTPAPFAGDDFIAIPALLGPTNKNGLQDSFFANGLRECLDCLLIEAVAWLVLPGSDQIDRKNRLPLTRAIKRGVILRLFTEK